MFDSWLKGSIGVASVAACLSMSVSAQAQLAQAQSAQALRWDDANPRVGWSNVGFVGVTGAVALVGLLIAPDASDPWRATLGVDEDVRGALRLTDAGARRSARSTSDVLAGVLVTYPVLFEAGVNAAWAKSSADVGLEMGVMHLEALAVTAALVNTSKWVFARERPYGRLCGTELSATSTDCTSRDRYASYFSGHAAFTFASASALCMQHVRWDLWGGAPAWVPCSTSYVLAATTALLRVGADRHYVTDIATGALIGTAVGLAVPWFHYRSPVRAEGRTWELGLTGQGVSLAGSF